MRGGPTHYDPLIEGAPPPFEAPEPQPEPTGPIQAVMVQVAGLYLRLDDVVAELRRIAFDLGHRSELSAREAVEAAAAAFEEIGVPETQEEAPTGVRDAQDAPHEYTRPVVTIPLEQPDTDTAVYRVEVFPDADGKWYARSVDSLGNILDTRNGSFDHEYVLKAARDRWPDVEIHELQDAQMDSIWEEEHHAFSFNGRRRPSPRRLFAGVGI